MSHSVGEIVVYRRSKAKTLKAKVYKVAERADYSRVRCVSPSGRSQLFRDYDIQSLDDYVRTLEQRVRMAVRDEDRAKNRTVEARNTLNQFLSVKNSASSLF